MKPYQDREAWAAGAKCGRAVARLLRDEEANQVTVHRAAVAYVNRLPLNDVAQEAHLVQIFDDAANVELRYLRPTLLRAKQA